jgi:hypothetical protein
VLEEEVGSARGTAASARVEQRAVTDRQTDSSGGTFGIDATK